MAHAPEKLIGELVLFIMDLAVNKESGMLLYRLHDDLWLCGKPEQCATAWKSMERFAKVTGVEFNLSKTGSVYLTENQKQKDPTIVSALPSGPVTVGLLTLDPTTSTWVLSQPEVSAHVTQLQKQLAGCTSVLSWIQTWNSCISRFFSHTFGEPAACFGRQHVDSILETHKQIQKTLFAGSSVTAHLKSMLSACFGVHEQDVPDAFLFLPEQLGGLGLRNPFVPFFLVRERLTLDPKSAMLKFLAREREEYADAKKAFEQLSERERRQRFENHFPDWLSDKMVQRHEQDTFLSFETYTGWRESTSASLRQTYVELLSTPEQEELSPLPGVQPELDVLRWHLPELKSLNAETRWLVELHAAELFDQCGGLSMVEKRFLPLGVLTMMRSKKVTWQMVL